MATPDAVRDAPPEGTPAPKQRQKAGTYSGRLLLRMPRTLHEELAKASELDGVSLNQFITGVLASAIGWRQREGGEEIRSPAYESARWRALRMNVIVLSVVGVIAVALLVVELVQRL